MTYVAGIVCRALVRGGETEQRAEHGAVRQLRGQRRAGPRAPHLHHRGAGDAGGAGPEREGGGRAVAPAHRVLHGAPGRGAAWPIKSCHVIAMSSILFQTLLFLELNGILRRGTNYLLRVYKTMKDVVGMICLALAPGHLQVLFHGRVHEPHRVP